MATKISDTEMSSDQTRHTATAVSGSRYGSWAVTWLPGLCLSYDQAITAMTIAEVVGAHDVTGDPLHAGHRLWAHLDGWAAELGITGPRALAAASLSPEGHADMPRVRTLAFDSEPGRPGYLLSVDAAGMARVRIDGKTVIMPAAHLQYDSAAESCPLCQLRAELGVEPPPGGCTCQASPGQLAALPARVRNEQCAPRGRSWPSW
jgi:hypothetical protein